MNFRIVCKVKDLLNQIQIQFILNANKQKK